MIPPAGLRAVLFDAGGTLIYLDGDRICRAAGVPPEAGAFARAEAAATAAMRAWIARNPASTDATRVPVFFDGLLRELGVEEETRRSAAALAVGQEHARANLWSRAGEGALETLGTLRERGYRLGVISNADGRVRGLLDRAGLSPFLEVLIDSFEVGVEKPDPRIFIAATERLGLPPRECAYVGDVFEIDVIGSRAAGLHPILIGAGGAQTPVDRVGTLPDLLPLFPPLSADS